MSGYRDIVNLKANLEDSGRTVTDATYAKMIRERITTLESWQRGITTELADLNAELDKLPIKARNWYFEDKQ